MTVPATTAAPPLAVQEAPLPAGVRLELLRAGDPDQPLFLAPGLASDPGELDGLVAGLTGPAQVYAIAPSCVDVEPAAATMVGIATSLLAAVRQRQPHGPYRLGGYSFGALLALEMAQQLRADGEQVEALLLVDAVYDERYWAKGRWLLALLRRTGRQLGMIVRLPPHRAVGQLWLRSRRLVQRFARRLNPATDPLHEGQASERDQMVARAYAAIAGYRPRWYDGAMTVIASANSRHFGCDTVRLWDGLAARLDVQRIDADHLTVMDDPTVRAVSAVVDHRLAMLRPDWPGLRPRAGFQRPLIVTTMRWFAAARLAHALTEAGFAVAAYRPRGHALAAVDGLAGSWRLGRVRDLATLARAIRQARPDIILPDDERALVLLRRLHTRVVGRDAALAALIARSLGDLAQWPAISSRAGLADVARALGLPTPDTTAVRDLAQLEQWAVGRDWPLVLKTDGSWGGRGVLLVTEPAHLRRAWRGISRPPSLARAVKRALVNREGGALAQWLRRTRPVVNAQTFVAGREAIATLACADGEVLGLVCLEVVRACQVKGAAAVVRTIEHPGMARTATELVRRLGLNGFCGFDFILTDTGEAQLLELNPRVTPTAHLLVDGEQLHGRTIEIFPPDPNGVPGPDEAAVLDAPVRAPLLVRRGEEMAAKKRRPVARVTRHLTHMMASRY